MTSNIRLSHMSHWKTVPYKQIDNFRDFYYEDKSAIAYYSDWDRILRYHQATGYEGIELAPWDLVEILGLFGSPEAYREFAAERGVLVSGMFHGLEGGHDANRFDEVVTAGKSAVDTLKKFGGTQLNACPAANYYGTGPLSDEHLANTVKAINAVGEYAVDNGIQIGIHNEFFCSVNKDNHRRFIEATDPRFVFYCLDTAQIAIIGEDMVKFYDDYHQRITSFHLKDTASLKVPDSIRYARDVEITDDGTRWFWEPGEGVLDFASLWQLLKKYQFKGWMTVETDGTPDLLASMALSSYFVNHDMAKIYR